MSEKKMNTELLDKAMIFAIKAHSGVERRGKGSPYVIHPMEAMAIVETITNDQELLAATVLHDVVEDTEYTIEDIKNEFGERIADLVAHESDLVVEGKTEEESWKERKQFAIDRLKNANKDVKIVAIGDKLSNARALYRDYKILGDKLWDRFHTKDPKDHAWHYRGLLDALSELEGTNAFSEFKYRVNKLFENIA